MSYRHREELVFLLQHKGFCLAYKDIVISLLRVTKHASLLSWGHHNLMLSIGRGKYLRNSLLVDRAGISDEEEVEDSIPRYK